MKESAILPSRCRIFILRAIALAFTPLAAQVAFSQATNQITAVSPGFAPRGASGLTVTFSLDTDVPPAPPTAVSPDSVMLGTLAGASVARPSQYTVTAVFDIPAGEATGAKDAAVTFTTPNGTLTYSLADAFTVTAGTTYAGYNLFSPVDTASLSPGGDDDGDGATNEDEQAAGTNPTDAASCLRVTGISFSGDGCGVTWSCELDKTYTLMRSTDLVHWEAIATGLSDTRLTHTHLDPPAGVERAFYRVTVE